MGVSDGRLCFSEKEIDHVWEKYIEGLKEENKWDQIVEADTV